MLHRSKVINMYRGRKEMEQLKFGDIVRRRRKELNMSQEDLADNLMATSTLSKIENGQVRPEKHTVEYLMKKLNMPYFTYGDYLTIEFFQERMLFSNAIKSVYNNMDDAEELLVNLKKLSDNGTSEERQLYLLCHLIWYNKQCPLEDFSKQCAKILMITRPELKSGIIQGDIILRPQELLILNNIGLGYLYEGNIHDALSVFSGIMNVLNNQAYFNTNFNTLRAKGIICNNLAVSFLALNDYDHAMSYNNKSFDYISKAQAYDLWFNFIFTKYDIINSSQPSEGNFIKGFLNTIYTYLSMQDITGHSLDDYLIGRKGICIL